MDGYISGFFLHHNSIETLELSLLLYDRLSPTISLSSSVIYLQHIRIQMIH